MNVPLDAQKPPAILEEAQITMKRDIRL